MDRMGRQQGSNIPLRGENRYRSVPPGMMQVMEGVIVAVVAMMPNAAAVTVATMLSVQMLVNIINWVL